MNSGWETLNNEDDVIHLHQKQLKDVSNTQIAFQLIISIQEIWSKLRSSSEAQIFDEGLNCL